LQSHFFLLIAETDGTIELDFPPLDRREPISKFGFTTLGLIEIANKNGTETTKSKGPDDRRVVLVLPDGTFSMLEIETRDVSLKELMEKALSRRKAGTGGFTYNYNIELKDAPGEPLDQDSLLSGYDVNEFYIVREHSKRKEDGESIDLRMKHQISVLEAPVYKEYHDILMYTKVRTKVEVMLGISEDKLEIYPKHR
jgi:target of rapamycin complex 2 subunit MAPKAP1